MSNQIFAAGEKVKVKDQVYKVLESPTNVNAANFAAFYKLKNTWTKEEILVHAKHIKPFDPVELKKNFYHLLR